jgi:hypothetical protein
MDSIGRDKHNLKYTSKWSIRFSPALQRVRVRFLRLRLAAGSSPSSARAWLRQSSPRTGTMSTARTQNFEAHSASAGSQPTAVAARDTLRRITATALRSRTSVSRSAMRRQKRGGLQDGVRVRH